MTLRLATEWTDYCRMLRELPYGKTLPTAVYLHRETPACQSGDLANLLSTVAKGHAIDQEFNVGEVQDGRPSFVLSGISRLRSRSAPCAEECRRNRPCFRSIT